MVTKAQARKEIEKVFDLAETKIPELRKVLQHIRKAVILAVDAIEDE